MHQIENQLKSLILKDVDFQIDGKTIKKGKVRVFNTKQFFIKFKIETDGDSKDFEIPYPFQISKIDQGYLFNYCLSAFCPRTEDSYWKMLLMDKSGASKLHNNHLIVISPSTP